MIAMLLVLAMIFGITPVSASEVRESDITLGETVSINLWPNEKYELVYRAESSGDVVIYSKASAGRRALDSGEVPSYIDIIHINSVRQEGENSAEDTVLETVYVGTKRYDAYLFTAEAGKTYRISLMGDADNVYTGTLGLIEAVPSQTVKISDYSQNAFAGDTIVAEYSLDSECTFENCSWEISGPEDVEYSVKYNVLIAPVTKAGTYTITVTTDGGATDSVTVAVKEREPIAIEQTKAVTMDMQEENCYIFTATEDAELVAYTPNLEPFTDWMITDGVVSYSALRLTVRNAQDGYYPSQDVYTATHKGIRFNVTAGETYMLYVYNGTGADCTSEFTLAKNKEVESFTLVPSYSRMRMDKFYYVFVDPKPVGAFGDYVWSSSDNTVCTVDPESSVGDKLYLTTGQPGIFTLTATEAGGKSASSTFTVHVSHFDDVTDPGAYYLDPLAWAYHMEITRGYGSENTFCPDVTCTRAQVVTFLWRARRCPEPVSTVNPFVDVKETDYYYKAVLWAAENGITAGYGSDDIFNPDGACTRAQVATFLWRSKGEPLPISSANPFTDLSADQYYYNAVLWAVERGVTKGYGSEDIFAPDLECTRAQIVTFLYRSW